MNIIGKCSVVIATALLFSRLICVITDSLLFRLVLIFLKTGNIFKRGKTISQASPKLQPLVKSNVGI
jgi:hypothetical protein